METKIEWLEQRHTRLKEALESVQQEASDAWGTTGTTQALLRIKSIVVHALNLDQMVALDIERRSA